MPGNGGGPPDKYEFLSLDPDDTVALTQLNTAKNEGWNIVGFMPRTGVYVAVLEGKYHGHDSVKAPEKAKK